MHHKYATEAREGGKILYAYRKKTWFFHVEVCLTYVFR
ncbi:hypothetical protein JOC34_001360 [Virgibacillus halotolerans]|nr:hypothetical protein [Virgibacillus halotolerans]